MRRFVLTVLLALFALCAGPGRGRCACDLGALGKDVRPIIPIRPGDFVRVEGDHLVLGGRPFAFVGANVDPLHGEVQRQSACGLFQALRRDGMSVARVWALGEGMPDGNPWSRRHALFRAGPVGYLDHAYDALDEAVETARAAGVRLIITLSNHWGDYGGIPMYLRWAGLPEGELGFEAFYRDPRTRGFYRDHVVRLLTRVNRRTGVRYVDDPTIMAWELMNESTVRTPEGAAARRAWIVEMARLIRAYDRNHLIGPGLLGYESLWERVEWVAVHQLPEVDYCDSHLYADLTRVPGAERAGHLFGLLRDRAVLARRVVGKPLIIGEFGFRTDGQRVLFGAPRARWFGRLVDQVLADGGSGALAWIYEPFSGKKRDYGIYTDRPLTEDIRAALRQRGLALRARGDLPPPPRALPGERGVLPAPAFQPQMTLRQAVVHGGWRRVPGGQALALPPGGFSLLRFERGGTWDAPPPSTGLPHAYGADRGRIEYRFYAPRGLAAAELRLVARLSSEWPGGSAPQDGGSLVQVAIDGAPVGTVRVMADDGNGRLERLASADPALLRRVLAPGVHTLAFIVDGVDARGLCIYGDRPGAGLRFGDAAGPIELRLLTAP